MCRSSRSVIPFLSALAAALLGGCRFHPETGGPGDAAAELSGRGYVHYHLYPDIGQCYCGVEYDFESRDMMVAAISESVHSYYGERLCQDRKYAYITSLSTGKQVRVLVVDKGGMPTRDFSREDQHIMDLSREAFLALDADGNGYVTGRIHVKWELAPADPAGEPGIRRSAAARLPAAPR